MVEVAKKDAAVGVLVPTTRPFASTERMRFCSPVSHVAPELVSWEEEALVAKVEEAMREKGVVAFNQRAVEVAFTATPAYVSGVKAKAVALPGAQTAPVFVIFPVVSVWRQLFPEAAAMEGTVRRPFASIVSAAEVEVAVPVTVVVAR